MTVDTDDYSSIKRRLIVRDALTFLSLLLVTVVLLLITLFLFRSFAAHRDDLARRWSSRGRAALAAGRPDQAIVALRTALSYAPGERSYELLLAQALGEANHTEESYNYFLSLWETQPGDGFINLNLARLDARKRDSQAAIHYYRAAVYGTWEGDGTVRRREVRLELARYLISQHDPVKARTELLVAGSNDPDDPTLALTLAPLLESVGDTYSALQNYEKVLAQNPDNQAALAAAGRLHYQSGNFEEAYRLLERADRLHGSSPSTHPGLSPETQTILDNSERILALTPFRKRPPADRIDRVLRSRALAKARFNSCSAQLSSSGNSSSPLQGLAAAWGSKEAALGRAALLKEPNAQDDTMKLIFDTERQTAALCGPPTGDDKLLLLLANSPGTMEP